MPPYYLTVLGVTETCCNHPVPNHLNPFPTIMPTPLSNGTDLHVQSY